jgi:hypothetical protein
VDGRVSQEPAGVGDPGVELDATGWRVLPSAVEPHAHLDKALTAPRVDPAAGNDLPAAIAQWQALVTGIDSADIAERALAAVREVDPDEIPLVRVLLRLRGLKGLPEFETVSESPAEIVYALAWAPRGLEIRLGFRFDGETLATETRVRAASPASRRRFRLYWLAIRPFSGLIRHLWLREIKRWAECT